MPPHTSFVVFPRLVTTLEKEGYTGYVRLLTDDATGLILFREGSALECMYDGSAEPGGLVLGKPALQQFNEDVTGGHGVIDVVGLSPELVDGLYELTVSKAMYTELYAAWVVWDSTNRSKSSAAVGGKVNLQGLVGLLPSYTVWIPEFSRVLTSRDCPPAVWRFDGYCRASTPGWS